MDDNYQYDAFISYRHVEPDRTIAEKLHKMLEAYALPKTLSPKIGSRKLKRIFRDKDELPINSDLSESIHQALETSRFLIVICSKKTNESKWVRMEIEIFKQLHGLSKILTLLVDGEPQDSFPEELRFFKQMDGSSEGIEPHAADIRASSLSASIRLLRYEKLRVLAPLYGCTYDELRQRHRERFIKKLGLIIVGITIFSLLYGSFILWQNAKIQAANIIIETRNNELTVQVNETNEQRDNALYNQSQYLANYSGEQLLKGDVILARLLALEALPKDLNHPDRPLVEEAVVALRNTFLYMKSGFFKPLTVLYAEAASFSSDSKWIVACDNEAKTYGIWDAVTLKKLISLPCDTGASLSANRPAKFNHKGDIVATISINGDMFLWNPSTGHQIMVFHLDNCTFTSVAFSPDDTLILTTNSDYSAKIWDATTGSLLFSLNKSIDAEFSPDGRYILTTTVNDGTSIWDVNSRRKIKSYSFGCLAATFSPDGKKIAVAYYDSSCLIMDVDFSEHPTFVDETKTKNKMFTIPNNETLWYIAYRPDGKILATSTTDKVFLWNAQNDALIQCIDEYEKAVFSPDGSKLLITFDEFSSSYEKAKTLICDISTKHKYDEETAVFDIAKYVVTDDGDILCHNRYTLLSASSKNPGSIYIWKTETSNEPACTLFGASGEVIAADISKEGDRAATIAKDGTVIIWDIKSTKQLLTYKTSAMDESQVKYCNGDKNILYISGNKLTLLDVKTGQEVYTREIPGLGSHFLVINPDGSRSAVVTNDNNIQILDSLTGIQLYSLDSSGYINDLKFSVDGNYMATCNSESLLYIWNVKNGKLMNIINNQAVNIDFLNFSPDNDKILIGDNTNSTITIRNILTGKEVGTIRDTSQYLDASFSDDGTRVITVDKNYNCCIYQLKPLEEMMSEAIGSLCGRELSDKERMNFFVQESNNH